MDYKNWLESLTVRSQLLQSVGAIYAIAKLAGLDLPDGIVESIVNGGCALAFVIGGIGVLVGRWKAKKPLTLGATI